MASDPLFGWATTLKTVEKDIKRKSDILIAFIHWNLTKRGFRTIGIGDERTLSGDEEKSEVLPTGWNDKDNYTLRYVLNGKLYILHGLLSDGSLIVNLVRSEDLAVSNLALNIDDTVKEMSGSVDKMLPNHKDLMYYIKRDLINIVTENTTNTIETQTTSSGSNVRRPSDDPLRITPRPMPIVQPSNRDLWEVPPGPPNLGRSDLDPFAPGGSGMLFNPFQGPRRDLENPGLGIPGGLPRFGLRIVKYFLATVNAEVLSTRGLVCQNYGHTYNRVNLHCNCTGAVPPGARFDPFGPPGVPMPNRRPPPPDADHLPPPGFNDNMFM